MVSGNLDQISIFLKTLERYWSWSAKGALTCANTSLASVEREKSHSWAG